MCSTQNRTESIFLAYLHWKTGWEGFRVAWNINSTSKDTSSMLAKIYMNVLYLLLGFWVSVPAWQGHFLVGEIRLWTVHPLFKCHFVVAETSGGLVWPLPKPMPAADGIALITATAARAPVQFPDCSAVQYTAIGALSLELVRVSQRNCALLAGTRLLYTEPKWSRLQASVAVSTQQKEAMTWINVGCDSSLMCPVT